MIVLQINVEASDLTVVTRVDYEHCLIKLKMLSLVASNGGGGTDKLVGPKLDPLRSLKTDPLRSTPEERRVPTSLG